MLLLSGCKIRRWPQAPNGQDSNSFRPLPVGENKKSVSGGKALLLGRWHWQRKWPGLVHSVLCVLEDAISRVAVSSHSYCLGT
jgi:hypothetical protein